VRLEIAEAKATILSEGILAISPKLSITSFVIDSLYLFDYSMSIRELNKSGSYRLSIMFLSCLNTCCSVLLRTFLSC